MDKIVIVGGGAGGLELATELGHKLGRKKKAHITLVDKNRTHLWKPLLHEVAAGSLDDGIDALSFVPMQKIMVLVFNSARWLILTGKINKYS